MTSNPKIDDRVWKTIYARIRGIRRGYVKVGVVGASAKSSHGGKTNAELMAIHEYGAPEAGIPERRPIRITFEARRADLAKLQAKLAKSLIAGKVTVAHALGLLGAFGAGAIKATITQGNLVPNAPATIAAKGSSRPLVDTGQLVGAISWVVVE